MNHIVVDGNDNGDNDDGLYSQGKAEEMSTVSPDIVAFWIWEHVGEAKLGLGNMVKLHISVEVSQS